MKKTTSKRKKRERRTLATALILGGIIMAGGTFAWFTARDEVTNRLTAEAKYNVGITESFTPPSTWIPGQVVDKQVGTINTGNIDAFVKLMLKSQMELEVKGTPVAIPAAITDENASTFIELTADEVTMLQAGAILAYTNADGVTAGAVSTSFEPEKAGVYVFARTLNDTTYDDPADTTYEFAGYYFDGTNCYAIAEFPKTGIEVNPDGTIKSGLTANSVKLQTVEKIDLTEMTMDYSNLTSTSTDLTDEDKLTVVATYKGKNADDASDDVIIDIILDEEYADNWQFDATQKAFYLKKTLAPGVKSDLLVSALKLDPATVQGAYYTFNYDLTILSDSVQTVPTKSTAQDAVSGVATAVDADADWGMDVDDATAGAADESGNVLSLTDISWEAEPTTTTP